MFVADAAETPKRCARAVVATCSLSSDSRKIALR
jgi:hypothetical protein